MFQSEPDTTAGNKIPQLPQPAKMCFPLRFSPGGGIDHRQCLRHIYSGNSIIFAAEFFSILQQFFREVPPGIEQSRRSAGSPEFHSADHNNVGTGIKRHFSRRLHRIDQTAAARRQCGKQSVKVLHDPQFTLHLMKTGYIRREIQICRPDQTVSAGMPQCGAFPAAEIGGQCRMFQF